MLAALILAPWLAQLGDPIEITDFPGECSAFATGDFDGDGIDDVLLAVKDLERLVLAQGDSSGTLRRSRVVAPSLASFTALILTDLDGDGDGDVAAMDESSGRVYAYVNLGGSALAPPTLVADFGSPLAPSVSPFELASGDANGDGATDILVAVSDNTASTELGVWLIESVPGATQGATAFAPRVRYWAEAGRALAPSVEDVDGDGAPDLVLVRPQTSRVVWARNVGTLPFASTAALTDIIPGLVSAQIGDVDADGTPDVLATSNGLAAKLQIARGLGGGAFAPSTDFQPGANATRRRIRIQLADLDGDGILDILEEFMDSTNRFSVSWFRNLGSGATLANHVFLRRAFGERLGASIADLDGDGQLDVVSGVGSGTVTEDVPVKWHVNEVLPPLGIFRTTKPVTLKVNAMDWATAADLNGDGLQDLILGRFDDEAFFADGRGRGEFARLDESSTIRSAGYTPLLPLDFDGDGDLDLLSTTVTNVATGSVLFDFKNAARWMINDGDAGFTAGPAFGTPLSEPISFTGLLDDDGDGTHEVIELVGNELRIHARDAQGDFVPGTGRLLGAGNQVFTGGVAIGDMDGDGLEDLVYRRSFSFNGPNTLRFLRNLPGVGFASEVQFGNVVAPGSLQVVDLDQDGDLDLVAMRSDGEARMLRNEGSASAFTEVLLVPSMLGASETRFVVAMDANGDGQQDLVRAGVEIVSAGNFIVSIGVAAGQGGGAFGNFADLPVRESNLRGRMYPADVDGDGDQDLVVGWSDGVQSFYPGEATRWLGVSECGPAVPNITGEPGQIQAVGSDLAADDRLSVQAFSLVRNTLGIFITSQTAQVTQLSNSLGRLCLGGNIGRFTRPGDTITTGPGGFMELEVGLGDIPTAQGPVSAIAGQTWRFQAWTRDLDPATMLPTSNFTDAVAVTLR